MQDPEGDGCLSMVVFGGFHIKLHYDLLKKYKELHKIKLLILQVRHAYFEHC